VAAATDSAKQLAWEARHRIRAGVAALIGTAGLLVFYIGDQVLQSGAPTSSGLAALQRAVESGPVGELQSLRAGYFEYLDDRTPLLIAIGLGGFLGFLGMAWAVGFIGVAIRAREGTFRRFVLYLPIVGGVVVGISVLLAQVGSVMLASDFLESRRTVAEVSSLESDILLWARILFQFGSLMLAIGLLLVSLNAMRAGLLTRLFGYTGIVAGAMLVLFPLPVVQIFWLAGLGMLFLGRWPGGDLPAWRSGRAEPWPTRPPAARPAPQPATPSGSSGTRRKRKKRH
jgi:hypothetical protein